MDHVVPLFEPARVPRHRKRRTPAATAPAPAVVTILSVTSVSPHEVDFAFSAAVTSLGGAGNEQMIIVADGSDNTPASAEQVDATTIRFWFDGVITAGNPWHVDAVPDGLDFHGRTFTVPQSGVVA